MSIQLVIDMNLSPDWVTVLEGAGWSSVHWSQIGDGRAADSTILEWALANRRVVLTHDLDFGTLLALTHARGPSVLQIRVQDVLPSHAAGLVLATLRAHANALAAGAIVVIDESRARIRILPLQSSH